jgi:hypothetical protein
MQSSVRAPAFVDGSREVHPSRMNEQAHLVLDIRTIILEKGKKSVSFLSYVFVYLQIVLSAYHVFLDQDEFSVEVQPSGGRKSFWALLPLAKELVYGDGAPYINNGIFQLPLIEGSVRASILDSPKPFQALLDALSAPKGDSSYLRLSDGASVLVVLQNPLLVRHSRSKEVMFGIDPANKGNIPTLSSISSADINTYWMQRMIAAAEKSSDAAVRPEKFTFDLQRYVGVKTIASQLPAAADFRRLEKTINKNFVDYTGITGEAV